MEATILTSTYQPTSDSDILSRVRDLVPDVAERAEEIERTGQLPPALVSALVEAGCLRMAVSARYGGDDLSLPATLAVVEELARADGSVGWTVGQAALSQVMISYLPEPSLERIYADGPDVWVAGAAAPKGHVTAVESGWRVSGRWPLVSGIPHASWVFLQCVVVRERSLQADPGGKPALKLAVLPAREVSVLETWDSLGLRGTASHDVQVRGASCPDELTCELRPEPPEAGNICRIPPQALGGPFIAASALGIAHGAIDALTDLVRGGKRPAFSLQRLAESESFQHRFGDAQLTLHAARSLLEDEVSRADERSRGGALDALDRARLRAASVKSIELAYRVTETAFSLGGSSSVYARSPLERRLRDARTAAQHFAAGRDFYTPLGAILAGETPAGPLP
jgi:alkylation response protein AidB-like acyl-CoA dehydrogenase